MSSQQGVQAARFAGWILFRGQTSENGGTNDTKTLSAKILCGTFICRPLAFGIPDFSVISLSCIFLLLFYGLYPFESAILCRAEKLHYLIYNG